MSRDSLVEEPVDWSFEMIKETLNSSNKKSSLDDGKVESKLVELQQDMIRLSRAGLNELDFHKGVIRLVSYTTKLCNRIFSDKASSRERMKQAYGLALKAKLFLETVSKEFGESTGKLLDLKASIHFNLASWHHNTQNMTKFFEILLEAGKFCYRLIDMNFPSGAVVKVLTWLAWAGIRESNHSLAIQYSRTLENVLYVAMEVRCDDPVEHETTLAESVRRAGGESLKTLVLLSLSYYFSAASHANLANEKKAQYYCQKLQSLVPKRIQQRGKPDDWEIFKEMIRRCAIRTENEVSRLLLRLQKDGLEDSDLIGDQKVLSPQRPQMGGVSLIKIMVKADQPRRDGWTKAMAGGGEKETAEAPQRLPRKSSSRMFGTLSDGRVGGSSRNVEVPSEAAKNLFRVRGSISQPRSGLERPPIVYGQDKPKSGVYAKMRGLGGGVDILAVTDPNINQLVHEATQLLMPSKFAEKDYLQRGDLENDKDPTTSSPKRLRHGDTVTFDAKLRLKPENLANSGFTSNLANLGLDEHPETSYVQAPLFIMKSSKAGNRDIVMSRNTAAQKITMFPPKESREEVDNRLWKAMKDRIVLQTLKLKGRSLDGKKKHEGQQTIVDLKTTSQKRGASAGARWKPRSKPVKMDDLMTLLKEEEGVGKNLDSEDKDLPFVAYKKLLGNEQLKALLGGSISSSGLPVATVPKVQLGGLMTKQDAAGAQPLGSRRMSVHSNMSKASAKGGISARPEMPVPLSPKNASPTPPNQGRNPDSNTATQSHKIGKAAHFIGAVQSFQQYASATGQGDKPTKVPSPADNRVPKSVGNFDKPLQRTSSKYSEHQQAVAATTPKSQIAEEDAEMQALGRGPAHRGSREAPGSSSAEQRSDVLTFVSFFRIFVEKYYWAQSQALWRWVQDKDTVDEMVVRNRLRGVKTTRTDMLKLIEAERVQKIQEGFNRVKEEFGIFHFQVDLNIGQRITSKGLTKVWLSHVDEQGIVMSIEVPNGARALIPIECKVIKEYVPKAGIINSNKKRDTPEDHFIYSFPWKDVVLKLKSLLMYDLEDPIFSKSIKVVLGYPFNWDDLQVLVHDSTDLRRNSIASNRHQVILLFQYLLRLMLTKSVVILGSQPKIELITQIRERLALDSKFGRPEGTNHKVKYKPKVSAVWDTKYEIVLKAFTDNKPYREVASKRFMVFGGAAPQSRPGAEQPGNTIPSMRLNLSMVPDESGSASDSRIKQGIPPPTNRLENGEHEIDEYYLNQVDQDLEDPTSRGMVKTGLSFQAIDGSEVICLRKMCLPVIKSKLAVLTWRIGENTVHYGPAITESMCMLNLKIKRGSELSFYSSALEGTMSSERVATKLEATIYLFENQDLLHVDQAFIHRILRVFPRLDEEERFIPRTVLMKLLEDPASLSELKQLSQMTSDLRQAFVLRSASNSNIRSKIKRKLPFLKLHTFFVPKKSARETDIYQPAHRKNKQSPRPVKNQSPRFGSSRAIPVSEEGCDPVKGLPAKEGREDDSGGASGSRRSSSVLFSSRRAIETNHELGKPDPSPTLSKVRAKHKRKEVSWNDMEKPEGSLVERSRPEPIHHVAQPILDEFDYLLSPYSSFQFTESMRFPMDFQIPVFEAVMKFFACNLYPPRIFLSLLKYSITKQVESITASTIKLNGLDESLEDRPPVPKPPSTPKALIPGPKEAAIFRETVKKLDNDIRNFTSGVFLQNYNTVKRVGERAKFYLRVRYQNKDYIVKVKYSEIRGQKPKPTHESRQGSSLKSPAKRAAAEYTMELMLDFYSNDDQERLIKLEKDPRSIEKILNCVQAGDPWLRDYYMQNSLCIKKTIMGRKVIIHQELVIKEELEKRHSDEFLKCLLLTKKIQKVVKENTQESQIHLVTSIENLGKCYATVEFVTSFEKPAARGSSEPVTLVTVDMTPVDSRLRLFKLILNTADFKEVFRMSIEEILNDRAKMLFRLQKIISMFLVVRRVNFSIVMVPFKNVDPNALKHVEDVKDYFYNKLEKYQLERESSGFEFKPFLLRTYKESWVIHKKVMRVQSGLQVEYAVITVEKHTQMQAFGVRVYFPKSCRTFLSTIYFSDMLNLSQAFTHSVFAITPTEYAGLIEMCNHSYQEFSIIAANHIKSQKLFVKNLERISIIEGHFSAFMDTEEAVAKEMVRNSLQGKLVDRINSNSFVETHVWDRILGESRIEFTRSLKHTFTFDTFNGVLGELLFKDLFRVDPNHIYWLEIYLERKGEATDPFAPCPKIRFEDLQKFEFLIKMKRLSPMITHNDKMSLSRIFDMYSMEKKIQVDKKFIETQLFTQSNLLDIAFFVAQRIYKTSSHVDAVPLEENGLSKQFFGEKFESKMKTNSKLNLSIRMEPHYRQYNPILLFTRIMSLRPLRTLSILYQENLDRFRVVIYNNENSAVYQRNYEMKYIEKFVCHAKVLLGCNLLTELGNAIYSTFKNSLLVELYLELQDNRPGSVREILKIEDPPPQSAQFILTKPGQSKPLPRRR